MEASSSNLENPEKEYLVSDALGSIAAFSKSVHSSMAPELNVETEVSEDKSVELESPEAFVQHVMEDEDEKATSKAAGVNSLSDMEYSSDENKTHSDNSSLEKIEIDAKVGEEINAECIQDDDDIEVIDTIEREENKEDICVDNFKKTLEDKYVEISPARNVYEPEISIDCKEVEHQKPENKVKDILAKAMEEISDKRIKEILEKTIEEIPDVPNEIVSEEMAVSAVLHESVDETPKKITEVIQQETNVASQEIIEELPVETIDPMSQEGTEKTSKQLTGFISEETIEKAPKESKDEIQEQTSAEIPKPLIDETPQDIIEKILEGPIDKIQQQIGDVTPQEIIVERQHEVLDETPQEKTNAALEEATSKILQELNEEIPSQLTINNDVPKETIVETTNEKYIEMQEETINEAPKEITDIKVIENTDASTTKENNDIQQEPVIEIAKEITDIVPNETITEAFTGLPEKVSLDINKVANNVMDEIPESPIIQMLENVIKEIPQNLIKEIPDKIIKVMAKKEETKEIPEMAKENIFGIDVHQVTRKEIEETHGEEFNDKNNEDVNEKSILVQLQNQVSESQDNSINGKEIPETESVETHEKTTKYSAEDQPKIHEEPMVMISESQAKDSEVSKDALEEQTKQAVQVEPEEIISRTMEEKDTVSNAYDNERLENPIVIKEISGKRSMKTLEETSEDIAENNVIVDEAPMLIDSESQAKDSEVNKNSLIEETTEAVLLESEENIAENEQALNECSKVSSEEDKDNISGAIKEKATVSDEYAEELHENATEAKEISEKNIVETLQETTKDPVEQQSETHEIPIATVSKSQAKDSDVSNSKFTEQTKEAILSNPEEMVMKNDQPIDECLKVTIEQKEGEISDVIKEKETIKNENTHDIPMLLSNNAEVIPTLFTEPKEAIVNINEITMLKLKHQEEANETANEIEIKDQKFCEEETMPEKVTELCEEMEHNDGTISIPRNAYEPENSDKIKTDDVVVQSGANSLDANNEDIKDTQNRIHGVQEVKEEETEEKIDDVTKEQDEPEEVIIEHDITEERESGGVKKESLIELDRGAKMEEIAEITSDIYKTDPDIEISSDREEEYAKQMPEEVKDEVVVKEIEISTNSDTQIETIQKEMIEIPPEIISSDDISYNDVQIIDKEESNTAYDIDCPILENQTEIGDEDEKKSITTKEVSSLSDMEYSSDENIRDAEDYSSEKQNKLSKEADIQEYLEKEDKDTQIKETFEIISEVLQENSIPSFSNLKEDEELEGSNNTKERIESKSDTSDDYDTCNEEVAKLTSTSTSGGYETCNEDIKEEDELARESEKLETKLMMDTSIVEEYDTCDEEVADLKEIESESSKENVIEDEVLEVHIDGVTSEVMNHPEESNEDTSLLTPETEAFKKENKECNNVAAEDIPKNIIMETMDEILNEMEEKKKVDHPDSIDNMEVFSKKAEEELEMKVQNHDTKPFVPHQSNPPKRSVLVRILQILLGCFNCFQGQAS